MPEYVLKNVRKNTTSTVSGGGGRRIPARSGRATVPRTDVPSSRAFILSTLLLAETEQVRWRDFWRSLGSQTDYPTLRTYTCLDQQNPVYSKKPWFHLVAFKQVT
jgi:hypothetical protein